MDRTELAWAAGFWDGEGSAWLTGTSDRATRQPQARINQASLHGMPEVLLRFQRAVRLGSLQGPDLVEGRDPLYRWVVSSRAEVRAVLDRLEPWLGAVKRAQLRRVLGLKEAVGARSIASDDELLAWCAGFYDGEGSTYLARHPSHPGYYVLEAAITQSSRVGSPEVLERFRNAFAAGTIYGPYPAGSGWAPVYRWKAHRREQIESIIARLRPWLGHAKRTQADAAMKVVAGQDPLPRGNPMWGNRKTHCVNGHEYATTRMRPFRGRGKSLEPPRASKQCLACVRDHARRKRAGKKKRAAADRPPPA